MTLIPAAWEADNVRRVNELLEGCSNKTSLTYAALEWHYWDRLCHAEQQNWTYDPQSSSSLRSRLSGDGKRIVCWKSELVKAEMQGNTRILEKMKQNPIMVSATTIRVLDVSTKTEVFSIRLQERFVFPNSKMTKASAGLVPEAML